LHKKHQTYDIAKSQEIDETDILQAVTAKSENSQWNK